jgi:TonB family protein
LVLPSDADGGTLDALKFSLASDIVELVVLTNDEAFLLTLREAVGAERRLWHVLSSDKVSDLLIAGEVGIVVLDVQALSETAHVFVVQIKRQFPDLVIIVAGNRDDENSLAGLISSGTVYRFIHKPMSPGRAKLFAEAAVKKYGEQRQRIGRVPSQRPPASSNRPWLIGGTVTLLLLIGVVTWVMRQNSVDEAVVAPASLDPVKPGESPLLGRAAVALAANHLTEPPGDNALELYLQAQARNPAGAGARAGLDEVHERLLARAENALLEERLDEAAAAIETARKSGVENGRIAFLSAQLAKLRDQVKTAQAQTLTISRTHNEPKAAQDTTTPVLAVAAQRLDAGTNERLQPEQPIEAASSVGFTPVESAAVQRVPEAALAKEALRDTVIPSSQLTLLKSVQPVYPAKAQSAKIEGWVELNFRVTEKGLIEDVSVYAVSVPGIFDAAAIKAVSQWRFKPVLQDSKPIAVRCRVRIRFALP